MSTRISLNSMSKLTGLLRHRTAFTHYKQWSPRGLRAVTTETGKFEPEKHKIKNGFGLIVVNENFCESSKLQNLPNVNVDKKNAEEFCQSANIKVFNDPNLKTRDLKADEMKDLFETICSQRAFDFSSNDAFICFISSHGNKDGICGTDKKAIPEDKILKPFKDCASLKGKPKLFFINSCRGDKKDTGVRDDKVVADHAHPIIHPFEADILVAHSSVDDYRSYGDVGLDSGSWFITELTKVFKKHAHNMNLTDMLTIVCEKVSEKKAQLANDESVPPKEYQQVPSFSSTLRKAVYFVPESDRQACDVQDG